MRKTLVALSLLIVSLPAAAGVWGARGVTRRFAVNGDRLYAADGRGVSVFDVSNPAAIRRIDLETSDDETHDVALMGTSDVIVATSRGLLRYAVANDGAIHLTGAIELRNITRIAASAQHVAAASGTDVTLLVRDGGGLVMTQKIRFDRDVRAVHFVDGLLYTAVAATAVFVHDPATAAEIALVPFDAADLARSGATLWAGGPQRLAAIDVSNPRAPRVAGRSGEAKLTAVAAAGTRVYGIENTDTLHVFDGSSPESPRAISTVTDWVHAIAASGTRLFLAGSIRDDENLPYETGVPVRVYDATNLAAPSVAGELREALGGPVSGVWTDGSIALVVDPPYLRVLDVSKTDAPVEMASLLVPRIQSHVRARDGKAILYGRSEVNFVDVSDPWNPKFLGTYDSLGHPPSAAAFLRDTIVEANEHSGLHVVDYGDPERPREVSTRMWHYHDVVAGDDAVYTMQLNTFLVLDVTDRTKIVDRQIWAVDGYAQLESIPPASGAPEYLVWRGLDHLMLLSLIEDRFHPQEVARIAMASPGVLGTSATSIYVTNDGSLSRIDVADPAAIHETGMRVSAPMQISVAGEKVVVADRYSVRVYGPNTASPPPRPTPPPPPRRRAARH